MNGMAAAVSEKGYTTTTIADIVRHARVSKRSFYENFTDKDACLVACYVAMCERALQLVAQVTASDLPEEQQLEAVVHGFLSVIKLQPKFVRTLLLQIHEIGPRGWKVRHQIHQRFEQIFIEQVSAGNPSTRSKQIFSPNFAEVVIGGLGVSLLVATEHGGEKKLEEWSRTVIEFVRLCRGISAKK